MKSVAPVVPEESNPSKYHLPELIDPGSPLSQIHWIAPFCFILNEVPNAKLLGVTVISPAFLFAKYLISPWTLPLWRETANAVALFPIIKDAFESAVPSAEILLPVKETRSNVFLETVCAALSSKTSPVESGILMILSLVG